MKTVSGGVRGAGPEAHVNWIAATKIFPSFGSSAGFGAPDFFEAATSSASRASPALEISISGSSSTLLTTISL